MKISWILKNKKELKKIFFKELGINCTKNLFKPIWDNIENQKKFLNFIAKELKFEKIEDWYKIKSIDLIKQGGGGLLSKYKNSLYKLFSTVYSEYDWKPWLFQKVPRSFWFERKNQKDFIEWFSKKFKIEKMEDWYKITMNDIYSSGGGGLIKHFNVSLYYMLKCIYPEYDWKPWLFKSSSKLFWCNIQNQRHFLDWLGKELNIQKFEDWYQFSNKELIKYGGKSLSNHYNGSFFVILKTVYPEYDWKPWLMSTSPKSIWNEKTAVNNYIEWLEKQFEIKTLDDWYNISAKDICNNFKGKKLLEKYGGLKAFLLHYYPNHKWNLELLEKNSKRMISKSQYRLLQVIEKIFPNEIIEINYKHPLLYNKDTKGQMEFDIYLPSLNLAFEYQGEQHYFHHYLYGSNFIVEKRDENKIEICKKIGITLIHIPYWWDRKISSLQATIYQYKPDIIINIENNGIPIDEKIFPLKIEKPSLLKISFQFLEGIKYSLPTIL